MSPIEELVAACVRGGMPEQRACDLIQYLLNSDPPPLLMQMPVVDLFAEFWKLYPKRSGTNSRKDAQTAWRAATRKSTKTAGEIIDGVKRYAEHCDATQKTGTPFVMGAARFIRSEVWRQPMEQPNAQLDDDKRTASNRRFASDAAAMAGGFFRRLGED